MVMDRIKKLREGAAKSTPTPTTGAPPPEQTGAPPGEGLLGAGRKFLEDELDDPRMIEIAKQLLTGKLSQQAAQAMVEDVRKRQKAGDKSSPFDEVEPEEKDKTKFAPLGTLMEALRDGKITEREFMDRLAAQEYDVKDIRLLAELSVKTPPEVPLGTLLSAFKDEKLDADELRARLNKFGFSPQDQQLLLDINQPDKEKDLELQTSWKALNEGVINKGVMWERLREAGYDDNEINELMMLNDKDAQGKKKQGGTDGAGAEYDPLRKSTEPQYQQPKVKTPLQQNNRPKPENMLNDFRTAFATHIKNQGSGMGGLAKHWAMDNMDMFLNEYLGAAGQAATKSSGGGAQASDSMSPLGFLGSQFGAQAISTLYEGSKGSRFASSRSGPGATSAKRI